MRHFEGMVLQILENNYAENGTCYLKKFEGLRKKLILKIGALRLRTDLSDRAALTNGKDYLDQTNVTSTETDGNLVDFPNWLGKQKEPTDSFEGISLESRQPM